MSAGEGDGERVPWHGFTVKKGETTVYRDNKGRFRIQHLVIAEPENADELPDGPGTLGTVESVNDDGTVTVNVGGHRDADDAAPSGGGGE